MVVEMNTQSDESGDSTHVIGIEALNAEVPAKRQHTLVMPAEKMALSCFLQLGSIVLPPNEGVIGCAVETE